MEIGDDNEGLKPGEFKGEPGPALPRSPDGGIAPSYLAKEVLLPDATPENFVCLRNCRHFLQTVSISDVYAPTLSRRPVQLMRLCTAAPGVRVELDDDAILSCTSWDPLETDVIAARNSRRLAYFTDHPECEAADKENAQTYKAAPAVMDLVEGGVLDPEVCRRCRLDPCDCTEGPLLIS